jgi:hypothetical protein
MKKTKPSDYGRPVLLYPGITLRAGSIMTLEPGQKRYTKEPVDKSVDKPGSAPLPSKNKHIRPVCSKNKQ